MKSFWRIAFLLGPVAPLKIYFTPRVNRGLGISMLGIGALTMAADAWLKQSFHVAEHKGNWVDFLGGLAIGLGISFLVVSFSSNSDVEEPHQD